MSVSVRAGVGKGTGGAQKGSGSAQKGDDGAQSARQPIWMLAPARNPSQKPQPETPGLKPSQRSRVQAGIIGG